MLSRTCRNRAVEATLNPGGLGELRHVILEKSSFFKPEGRSWQTGSLSLCERPRDCFDEE